LIAKLIQEIGALLASIVEEGNDNNAPFQRLEQRRDVMVTDAQAGYCWTELSSVQCAPHHASDVLVLCRGHNDGAH